MCVNIKRTGVDVRKHQKNRKGKERKGRAHVSTLMLNASANVEKVYRVDIGCRRRRRHVLFPQRIAVFAVNVNCSPPTPRLVFDCTMPISKRLERLA